MKIHPTLPLSRFFKPGSPQGLGKVSLYWVMVVPLVIQVVGAVAVVGWLSHRNGQQAVNAVAIQLRSESSSRIQQHLDSYLSLPMQLNRVNVDAVELGLLDLQNFQQTGQYFWRQMQTFNVGYISYATPAGNFIGVERLDNGSLLINEKSPATGDRLYVFNTDDRGNRLNRVSVNPNYNPLNEAWYTDPRTTGKPGWSAIYPWDDKPEVLSISASYPLYDDKQQLIGVLGVDQILTQISDFLSEIRISQTGRTYIMERSGDLVATSVVTEKPFRVVQGKATRLKAIDSQDPLIRSSADFLYNRYGDLSQVQHAQKLDFIADGQQQFLLVMPWQQRYGLDWLIVVVVPESDFMALIHQNTRNTLFYCAIALAVATLLGIPVSRWIAQQILRLSRASEALADGELHQTFQARGIVELETLAQSFNRMAQQLRESFVALEQTNQNLEQKVEQRTASLAAAEAELRALFSAMNDLVMVCDQQGRVQKIVSTPLKFFIAPTLDADQHHEQRTIHDLFPQSQANLVMEAIQEANDTQLMTTVEYQVMVQGQDLWFSANISPLPQSKVLFVGRDISDLKLSEGAYRRVAEQLSQSEQQLRQHNQVLLELAKSSLLNQGDLRAATREITEVAVETLAVERASVWLFNESHTQLECIDQYQRSPETHSSGDVWAITEFAHYFQALESEGAIAPDAVGYTAGAASQITSGSTSILDTPIRSGSRTLGVVCLEQLNAPRQWTLEEQSFIRSMADLIALGIAAQERQRAEAALQEKDQYLRLILDNIPQQVFWKDTNLTFLGCNRNWAEAAGWQDPDEVVGKTDFDLLPDPEIARQFREFDRQVLEADKPQLHMIAPKVHSTNGTTTWLDISKIPFHDSETGQVIGILGVIDDITQRKVAEEALKAEQEKTELLLLNVLPAAIASRLKQGLGLFQDRHSRALIAESFDEVTIMFADIVNFTTMSSHISPTDLLGLLNRIFLMFDDLCERHGLEKIKTIGDSYMVVGGLPDPNPNHAAAIADMALDIQREISQTRTYEGQPIEVRIGINTGPVIAGVIGKKKFAYDLWGDAVNAASRMESHGQAGKIQVSAATYERLKHRYHFEERGYIDVKGKGEMLTYWLIGKQ